MPPSTSPRPLESWLTPRAHSVRWPNFERNAYVAIFALVLAVLLFALA